MLFQSICIFRKSTPTSSEHSGKGRVVNFFSSERVYPNSIKTIEKPSYTISSNVTLDNPPSNYEKKNYKTK